MPANAEEQSTITARMIRSAPISAVDPLCRMPFAAARGHTPCNKFEKEFRKLYANSTVVGRERMATVEPEDDGPPEDTEQRVRLLPLAPLFVTSTLHAEPRS